MFHFLPFNSETILILLTLSIIVDIFIFVKIKTNFLVTLYSFFFSFFIGLVLYSFAPYFLSIFFINLPVCYSRIPYPVYCNIPIFEGIIYTFLGVFLLHQFILIKMAFIKSNIENGKRLLFSLLKSIIKGLLLYPLIGLLAFLPIFFLNWVQFILEMGKTEYTALAYFTLSLTILILLSGKGISYLVHRRKK